MPSGRGVRGGGGSPARPEVAAVGWLDGAGVRGAGVAGRDGAGPASGLGTGARGGRDATVAGAVVGADAARTGVVAVLTPSSESSDSASFLLSTLGLGVGGRDVGAAWGNSLACSVAAPGA